MNLQVSQYSLWSFTECPITYFFACPACRKIWDIHVIHNYIDGLPLLALPFRCPDCNKQGEAFAESKTGMVEEIRIALAANEFDSKKELLNRKGDLPGLFRLNLKHSYLDMRVIAWENGGPAPISENTPSGWPSEDEFVHQFDHIFKVIDSWWKDEPFIIEILNNRINKRMDDLRKLSVDIPKNEFSKPYDEFLDNLISKKESREELTQEIMLKKILPPAPIDDQRLSLTSSQWPWIFKSEAKILLIDEYKSFKKKKDDDGLLLTIAKAGAGDLKALRRIIAWDYAWITCPWVSEIIRSRPYDFDIHEILKDALSTRPGYFKRKQKPNEKELQEESLIQFLNDRFCSPLKYIDKFMTNAFSHKDKDGHINYENIKKKRKRHLRK